MSIRSLTTFIQAEPALKPLMRRLSELGNVQRIYAQNVPQSLAKLGQVGSFRDGTLIIFAENGAAAAKLKQQLPEITNRISQQLQELIEIRVSVQVDSRARESKPSGRQKQAMSRQALQSLQKLANDLPPSPLQEEVALLVNRQSRN